MRPSFVSPIGIILLALPLLCCAADNSHLRFGETIVQIDNRYNIVYMNGNGKKQTIKVDLPHKETLHYVNLGNTNIVKAERYYDAWIVLIQTSKTVDANAPKGLGCETNIKALVVRDDGNVFLSKKTNGGVGCAPIDRDRHAYLSLAKPYIDEK